MDRVARVEHVDNVPQLAVQRRRVHRLHVRHVHDFVDHERPPERVAWTKLGILCVFQRASQLVQLLRAPHLIEAREKIRATFVQKINQGREGDVSPVPFRSGRLDVVDLAVHVQRWTYNLL